jgi:hypothetical protein
MPALRKHKRAATNENEKNDDFNFLLHKLIFAANFCERRRFFVKSSFNFFKQREL